MDDDLMDPVDREDDTATRSGRPQRRPATIVPAVLLAGVVAASTLAIVATGTRLPRPDRRPHGFESDVFYRTGSYVSNVTAARVANIGFFWAVVLSLVPRPAGLPSANASTSSIGESSTRTVRRAGRNRDRRPAGMARLVEGARTGGHHHSLTEGDDDLFHRLTAASLPLSYRVLSLRVPSSPNA